MAGIQDDIYLQYQLVVEIYSKLRLADDIDLNQLIDGSNNELQTLTNKLSVVLVGMECKLWQKRAL